MSAPLKVYYASAASNLEWKKHTQSLEFTLQKKKLAYDLIDVTTLTKEQRDEIFAKAGKRELPILYKGDTKIGFWEDIEGLIEMEQLDQVLA